MASEKTPIVCKYNGTLEQDDDGNAKYRGGKSKLMRVPKSSTLSELKDKIFRATGIAREDYEIKLIFMCPLGSGDYAPANIDSDSEVFDMLDMHPQLPSILILVDKTEIQRLPGGVGGDRLARGTYSQMLLDDSSSRDRLSPYIPQDDFVPSTYPVSKPAEAHDTGVVNLPHAAYTPPNVEYQHVGPSTLPEMAGKQIPPPTYYDQGGPSNYNVAGQQDDSYYAPYDDYQTYDRFPEPNLNWEYNYGYGEAPMQIGTPLQPSVADVNANEGENDPNNNNQPGSSRHSLSGRSASSFGGSDDSEDDVDDNIREDSMNYAMNVDLPDEFPTFVDNAYVNNKFVPWEDQHPDEKNDEIYDAMDVKEKELKEKLDLDVQRKDRSFEEMSGEAAEYRALFSYKMECLLIANGRSIEAFCNASGSDRCNFVTDSDI